MGFVTVQATEEPSDVSLDLLKEKILFWLSERGFCDIAR